MSPDFDMWGVRRSDAIAGAVCYFLAAALVALVCGLGYYEWQLQNEGIEAQAVVLSGTRHTRMANPMRPGEIVECEHIVSYNGYTGRVVLDRMVPVGETIPVLYLPSDPDSPSVDTRTVDAPPLVNEERTRMFVTILTMLAIAAWLVYKGAELRGS